MSITAHGSGRLALGLLLGAAIAAAASMVGLAVVLMVVPSVSGVFDRRPGAWTRCGRCPA
jgi:hypothetical protein